MRIGSIEDRVDEDRVDEDRVDEDKTFHELQDPISPSKSRNSINPDHVS